MERLELTVCPCIGANVLQLGVRVRNEADAKVLLYADAVL